MHMAFVSYHDEACLAPCGRPLRMRHQSEGAVIQEIQRLEENVSRREIGGKHRNVEKANEVINAIIMFGHHEITNPGETHEKIEVEVWGYSANIV